MNGTCAKRPVSLQSDSRELAEIYDQTSIHQFNNGKLLIESLRVTAGESILDVGAGTGQLGRYVAERVGPSGRVVGIDPLAARVEIASRKSTHNFIVRIGRAEDLCDLSDHTFDVVYLNSVFHWLEDKARALSEIFRVLKPGGRVGFNTTNWQRPHEFVKLVRQALAQESLTPGPSSAGVLHTPEALTSLVTDAGFIECRCSEHTLRDRHPDAESAVNWSASSQFGNFVASLDPEQFVRFRRALVKLIDAEQTADGIELERYLIFITARRPTGA